jgi:hypothetical protein
MFVFVFEDLLLPNRRIDVGVQPNGVAATLHVYPAAVIYLENFELLRASDAIHGVTFANFQEGRRSCFCCSARKREIGGTVDRQEQCDNSKQRLESSISFHGFSPLKKFEAPNYYFTE